MATLTPLGEFLEKLRRRAKAWKILFFVILAVLVAVNFFLTPEHPHFGPDAYPGFWAVFGLGVGMAMVIIMKKIIQPMIARDEEFYDVGD
ncbi:MAG: hypothetical protein AB7D57_08250 [Desulfovibrionaceae bacterium]